MKQIFYDPKTGQVMAEYLNCKYGGTAWQDKGYLEAECKDGVTTREHKVTVKDGRVTERHKSKNPEQPKRKREPTIEEILIETGAVTKEQMEAARTRLGHKEELKGLK